MKNQSISGFFLEAAYKELKRIRREQAMRLVERLSDPFSAISDPTAYIHELRRKDTEHRLDKSDL